MNDLYKRMLEEVEIAEIAYENLTTAIAHTRISFRNLDVSNELTEESLGIMERAREDLRMSLKSKISVMNEIADAGKKEIMK